MRGEILEELQDMISKLNENDGFIIRQLVAILFRYLEKRGRL